MSHLLVTEAAELAEDECRPVGAGKPPDLAADEFTHLFADKVQLRRGLRVGNCVIRAGLAGLGVT